MRDGPEGRRGPDDQRGPDDRGGERFRTQFVVRLPWSDLDQNLLLTPVARTLRALLIGVRQREPFSDVPSDVLRRVGQMTSATSPIL